MIARKKKHILIMLALCGAALVVDRMIQAGSPARPVTARAAGSAPDLPAVSATPARWPARPLIPKLPFPRSVHSWDNSSDLRDIFQPPQLHDQPWGGGKVEGRVQVDESPFESVEGTSHQAFASQHALHAVLVNGSLRIAIVDSVWVREGQHFDGCKLERISGNQASFSCYDGIVSLVSGVPDLPSAER